MEPASSDSESSYSSEDGNESLEEITNYNSVPKSFDELPSDDSGSEILSSSDENDSSSGSESDSDEDDNDDENLTLEERLRSLDNIGIKKYRMKMKELQNKEKKSSDDTSDSDEDDSSDEEKHNESDSDDGKKKKMPAKKKKRSKHAPAEVSSKRSEFYKRGAPELGSSGLALAEQSIGVNRYKPRDPRMDTSDGGKFNQEKFDKNYSFLDKMQQKEISELKKKIAARKVKGKKGQKLRKKLNTAATTTDEDREKLSQLTQFQANRKKAKSEREAKYAVRRKMRNEIKSGTRKKEFFYKKKDYKRILMEAKYDELMKKKGGEQAVQKALEKRRRKNLGKDGKLMPKNT